MKKIFPFILGILAFGCQVQAQQTQVVRGKVLDQETGQPLAFAHIGIMGNAIGTATNNVGEFIIKISGQYRNDTLMFSYLGYSPRRIPLASLQTGPVEVRLVPEATQLNEVFVTASVSAVDTLRKAIERISQNYSDTPVLLEGFYRETLKEDASGQYRLYAEGLLECYKPPYRNRYADDEVRIVKGRKKNLPYGGLPPIINGPRIGSIVDILKSREFFIHPGRFNHYHYRFVKVMPLNGEFVYVFAFTPRNTFANSRAYFSGNVYVQTTDLAFVRAEYELAEPGLATVNQYGASLRINSRQYTVNFTRYQDKWCLQDGSIENHFGHEVSGASLTSVIVFTVTRRRNENVNRFPKRELITDRHTFVEEVRAFDDNYWQEYNIIEEEANEQVDG